MMREKQFTYKNESKRLFFSAKFFVDFQGLPPDIMKLTDMSSRSEINRTVIDDHSFGLVTAIAQVLSLLCLFPGVFGSMNRLYDRISVEARFCASQERYNDDVVFYPAVKTKDNITLGHVGCPDTSWKRAVIERVNAIYKTQINTGVFGVL